MKSFLAFLVCIILALASFGFARNHYLQIHNPSVTSPFKKSATVNMSNPFFSEDLVGSWVKEEWVFALAIPAVLIASGLALAARK
jgi:hypothetical protein